MGVGIFSSAEYDVPSWKALNFIKSQMQTTSSGANRYFPVSYRTPVNNAQQDRCYIYDIGLALLVFTTSGDYRLCDIIMNRLNILKNSDGSFDFSYNWNDTYSSNPNNRVDPKLMTGAIGWLVWGMCYYIFISGNRTSTYMNMIDKSGDWLLARQVKTPTSDRRYGLLKGGYNATGAELVWCSTEHQCSALQALQGLVTLFPGKSEYITAANLVKANLLRLYNTNENRFYQGCDNNGNDDAWALDCTTWAGAVALKLLSNDSVASACRATAADNYLSSNGTVNGFKPYKDSSGGYQGSPSLVWTEGTLGYIYLCMLLRLDNEAKSYMDNTIIKLQNCNNSTGGVIYVGESFANNDFQGNVWESVCSSSWLYLLINNPSVIFPNITRSSINKVIEKIVLSTNWTVPAGVTSVAVFCVGGGGSGAGDYTSMNHSGSGGNGGVVTITQYLPVTPGTIIQIAVGAGGTGGVNGNGRIGSSSSFGSLVASAGGYGGIDGQPIIQTNSGRGGKSGSVSVNSMDLQGENGIECPFDIISDGFYGAGGAGANSAYNRPSSLQQFGGYDGGGNSGYGVNNTLQNRGQNATFYGAGGGGGAFSSNHTYSLGGNGKSGIVILHY